MSSKEGWVFVVYQRARDRCSAASVGWWPASVYQRITTVRANRPKGTVRSTAGRVRLRASPTPRVWRASKKAVSIVHRDA
ncbi:hypothetical protein [Streptomyces milbemycinicus]|uniref:Transposase n=1 Tax=Streptomyces milbemycinicus TaxID=476552 RepID=A0ABW8M3B2_9ACTN